MSKYIFSITPILDSIALKYPGTEIVGLRGETITSSVCEELLLSKEENVDKVQWAWINFGIGQLTLGTDGALYIKVPFSSMEQFMEKAINRLQECVKTLKPLDLARPATRMQLEDTINSNVTKFDHITIINQAESLEELTFAQWIYSEYIRIYESDAYHNKDGSMKDLNDLLIVYAVRQVFVS